MCFRGTLFVVNFAYSGIISVWKNWELSITAIDSLNIGSDDTIYLGIYYFRKLLYFIFFLYGLGLDIFWLNEIGPHLFVFMLYLIFVNFNIKYLYSLSSIKVYILIIILQFILVTLEMVITQVLFKINIDLVSYIKIIIFTIIFSYPLFILFLRIDKI